MPVQRELRAYRRHGTLIRLPYPQENVFRDRPASPGDRERLTDSASANAAPYSRIAILRQIQSRGRALPCRRDIAVKGFPTALAATRNRGRPSRLLRLLSPILTARCALFARLSQAAGMREDKTLGGNEIASSARVLPWRPSRLALHGLYHCPSGTRCRDRVEKTRESPVSVRTPAETPSSASPRSPRNCALKP